MVLLHADHTRINTGGERLKVCQLYYSYIVHFHSFKVSCERCSCLHLNVSYRIRGWWQAHHFITTVLTGIMLIWFVLAFVFVSIDKFAKNVNVDNITKRKFMLISGPTRNRTINFVISLCCSQST